MSYRIGVDVGGTNTDAVLMDDRRVVAWTKVATSQNVDEGIAAAFKELLTASGAQPRDISAVMIGTTHFTNALVERRRLTRVAAIRASLPANTSVPVAEGWPEEMRKAVDLLPFMVHGGAHFDGRPISAIDDEELVNVAGQIRRAGITSVAISAPFSPLSTASETDIADRLADLLPGVTLSLSHEIGRLGLLERENATILNAALIDLAKRTFSGFSLAMKNAGIAAPLFISQNDGTVMSVEYAERFPVRTLSSGPTNSMRGAAFLSGLDRAVVVDVGGTTTDAGALIHGFPREAASDLSIEGVRTNFRMPDVISIGVGGGSEVSGEDEGDVSVGPRSVGFELGSRARIFGGDTLTATDVAVAAGLANIGDAALVGSLDPQLIESAVSSWHERVDRLIAIVRGSAELVPVILVGGGSILIQPERLSEATECVVPNYFQVANAVGASIPQVSGEVDRVLAVAGDRTSALERCRSEAISNAVAAGAEAGSVVILDEEVVTLNLLGEDSIRIRVRAVGEVRSDNYSAIQIES